MAEELEAAETLAAPNWTAVFVQWVARSMLLQAHWVSLKCLDFAQRSCRERSVRCSERGQRHLLWARLHLAESTALCWEQEERSSFLMGQFVAIAVEHIRQTRLPTERPSARNESSLEFLFASGNEKT